MKSLLGAIGFLTTLPAGGDETSFEAFRRRIYVMPLAGFLIGLLCALANSLLSLVGLSFLAPASFLAVEGINHLDGLADFGDSLFAPRSRKRDAMKDLKTGAGGTVFVVLWTLAISISASRMSLPELFVFSLFAEVSAKSGMLLAITFSRPAWEGMGSYMMEYASKGATLLVLAFAAVVSAVVQLISGYGVLYAFAFSLVVSLLVMAYSHRTFGGVSGDVFGAINCFALASCLVFPLVKLRFPF